MSIERDDRQPLSSFPAPDEAQRRAKRARLANIIVAVAGLLWGVAMVIVYPLWAEPPRGC